MTNDEKVALVEKAKGIVEEELWNSQSLLREPWKINSTYEMAQRTVNSWLAHKSFFERHEGLIFNEKSYCGQCKFIENEVVWYPCPESVTTADLIANGVKDE